MKKKGKNISFIGRGDIHFTQSTINQDESMRYSKCSKRGDDTFDQMHTTQTFGNRK
jgi:hypothetical protein